MDERVRELLERVRETAVTVGEAAGDPPRATPGNAPVRWSMWPN